MFLRLCKLFFFTSLITIGSTQSVDPNAGVEHYPYEVNTHYKFSAAGFGPNYQGTRSSLRFSTAFDKIFVFLKIIILIIQIEIFLLQKIV